MIQRLGEIAMTARRFIEKLLRYRRRHGVYAAAQVLRRQGISLETAVVLLVHK